MCKSPQKKKQATAAVPFSKGDGASRYRLALLDAALVVETIAEDITGSGHSGHFARRCCELARQMREFAGYTTRARSFNDRGGQTQTSGTGLMAIVRSVRPWSRKWG